MAGSAVPTQIEHRCRGVVRVSVAILTDAAGDATATATEPVFGRLVGVLYDGGLDASASITVTDDKTGATVFGPYVTGTEGTPVALRPSQVIVDNVGVAVAAHATAPNVNRDIFVHGRMTVEVSAGGNAETAKLVLIVDEHGLGQKALTA
jgi:hypothetical protein